MSSNRGGTGRRLVLYNVEAVYKMEDLGLGPTAAVDHAVYFLRPVLFEHLLYHRGIRAGR